MIRFLITLAVSALVVVAIMFFMFDNQYNARHVSDAFFYVGLFRFFASLITLTDASTIFIAIGYTFKNIFTRYRQKYSDYYEYQQKRREERDSTTLFGIGALVIGIAYLAIALYYGYSVIN